MKYTIKAIPTTYRNVNFRSRLEARWAAFFDLVGVGWNYEPFDLNRWAPDFLLQTGAGNVLVEVKPVDVSEIIKDAISTRMHTVLIPEYIKASIHQRSHQVMLLGHSPLLVYGLDLPFGVLLSPPAESRGDYDRLFNSLLVDDDVVDLWRRAGNAVQWHPTPPVSDGAVPYHEFIATRFTEARQ